MYFQNGHISNLISSRENLLCIRSNGDRSIIACCSERCLDLWKTHPSIRLFQYQRSSESVDEYGSNKFIQWRTDGTGIAIVTNTGCVILCEIKLDTVNPQSYQCIDRKTGYKVHSIPTVPSLILQAVNIVDAEEEIHYLTSLNNDTLLFTTKSGHVKQFLWDEPVIIEEYSCKVSSFLFTDPTQHTFSPDEDLSIVHLCYSQALDIAAVAFSSGCAAYLATSHTFKPGTIHALLAPLVNNAVCASINPRFHLIVYGTSTGEVLVFILNYDTGFLNLSHKLEVYNDGNNEKIEPGRVTNMFWTPDGCCLCVNYESGLFRMWSVYGIFLYGDKETVVQGCWDSEGYNLWCINNTKIWKIPFLKSPLTTNSVRSNQHHIVLQGANQVYILPNQFPTKSGMSVYESIYAYESQSHTLPYESFLTSLGSPLENWPWQVIQVPEVYTNSNSPIRYVAIGSSGQCTAVAGVRGFAFYISAKHKWKCFGSEAQEQSTICRGGLLWWKGILIVACYRPETKQNEIQMYPHHNSLDVSSMVNVIPMLSTVITMNTHENYLIAMVGSSRVILYLLHADRTSTLDVTVCHTKVIEFSIAKFTPHPSAVLSVHLTTLKADASVPTNDIQSVLVNVAGRLLMFELNDHCELGKPLTVASNVEAVWCPAITEKYLSATIWMNCGIRGLRAWMPLHGPDQDLSSRRILLTLKHNVYPLVVHHREAAVLGMPLGSMHCASETFLHVVLRLLVCQNLGNHAFHIATTCSKLPYFHHTLELMLHGALEADMSCDHSLFIDRVLPHIVRFMKQLPHYLSAVAHCARKTEMTQWQYLFSATGSVQDLLDQCLSSESLDTAVSYLVILQNLHPLHVSRVYIVKLLEAAIKEKRWELGVDLLRFLRVISTESDVNPILKRKMTASSEFAYRLRRSSESTEDDLITPTTPSIDNVNYDYLASQHDASITDAKVAKSIITHHAHHFLKSCQFKSLGEMCYHLKFDLLQFLQNEKTRLCEIVDPVHVFMSIHEEFSWPYPDTIPKILDNPQVNSNMSLITVNHNNSEHDKKEFTLEPIEFEETPEFISDSNSIYQDSVYSECRIEIDPNIIAGVLRRGTDESEAQIKYFFRLFYDAGVYNYALLFALTLRNVDDIITVIQEDPSSCMLSYLMAIDCWGHQECGGYSLFLQSLKPHIVPLFPTTAQDLKLKPMVRISSVSSISSTDRDGREGREHEPKDETDVLTREMRSTTITEENVNYQQSCVLS